MAAFLKLDLRSLLLVLIAFIGNAQILGFDIVLAVCVIALFTQFSQGTKLTRLASGWLAASVVVLLIANLRADEIGIPYFEDYGLWPIKALILTLLIATGRDLTWPMGNMIALAFICIALVGVGRVEEGRLVSVFGPNMLYRVFGFLMIFGVMLYPLRRGKERLLMAGFAVFGLFASLLTGSSGAVLTIGVVVALASLRYSKKLSFGLGLLCLYLIAVLGPLAGSSGVGTTGPATLTRLTYKLTTLEASDRVVGWLDMMSQPFSPLGYDHLDFWYLWSFGYQYPHNLFVELFSFYGVIGAALCVAVIIALYRAVPKVRQGDILAMTLIVLAIGSMLSGDLSDNFGVIGLACGQLSRTAIRRPKAAAQRSRQAKPRASVSRQMPQSRRYSH